MPARKALIALLLALCLLCGCETPTVSLRPSPTPGAPDVSAPPAPSLNASAPQPSAAETPAKTPTPEASAEETPEAETAQPPLLSRVMAELDRELSDLPYDQLVLVRADGAGGRLYAYDKGADGLWQKALSFSCHVGEKGVSSGKREGDKRTPAGIFRLGFAFGTEESPNPDYPYRGITAESFFVDDPDSRFYNQWVEGEADRDWSSAETLANSPTAYALAVLVEYNYGAETEPGKGSAIFLHVGDEPTSGCIALKKADLTALVQWLREEADPHIVIVSA